MCRRAVRPTTPVTSKSSEAGSGILKGSTVSAEAASSLGERPRGSPLKSRGDSAKSDAIDGETAVSIGDDKTLAIVGVSRDVETRDAPFESE